MADAWWIPLRMSKRPMLANARFLTQRLCYVFSKTCMSLLEVSIELFHSAPEFTRAIASYLLFLLFYCKTCTIY
jgi:hypothetical protein